jgi:hypothetical protein
MLTPPLLRGRPESAEGQPAKEETMGDTATATVRFEQAHSAVAVLTRAIRAIGDKPTLYVRFPDGSSAEARVALDDWMGGTLERPYPDVKLVCDENPFARENAEETHEDADEIPVESAIRAAARRVLLGRIERGAISNEALERIVTELNSDAR